MTWLNTGSLGTEVLLERLLYLNKTPKANDEGMVKAKLY